MSSSRQRSVAIDFSRGSLPADEPPLKKRTIYHSTGSNEDGLPEHNALSPSLLHGLFDRALTPRWLEAIDSLTWLPAPSSPYALQTSSSIVEDTHHPHPHPHHYQNESEICGPPDPCKVYKKQDSCSNSETCYQIEFDVSLQGFKMSAENLFQEVDKWTWKRLSGSAAENAVPYKEEHIEALEYQQHPAPWLITTHWAPTLLMACAESISKGDIVGTNHLMWVLNRLTSLKDASLDCRMASYFFQALQCRVKGTGPTAQKRISEAIQNLKVDLERGMKKLLMWREVTPWSAFGQEAANAAIFEAVKGEDRVHVVDVSHWSSLCMQWPTFVEALATRPEAAPHFRLTLVIKQSEAVLKETMKAISNKITRFALLMGLPSFKFRVIFELALEKIDAHSLDLRLGEALVVNLNQTLQYVPTRASSYGGESPRDKILQMFYKCNPKIMVIVENEVDQLSDAFAERFRSLYRFVSVFVGSMDRPDIPANQARLLVQEEVAKIMIVNSIACDEKNGEGRADGKESFHENPIREQTVGWAQRLSRAGFKSVCLVEGVLHCVEILLKLYPSYWGLLHDTYQKDQTVGNLELCPSSITLTWRGYPIHTCTAWVPMQ
ncbi:hypothetical protein L7F22_015939 [Adiantum nelumboides]|nr:hypothetical protein [Adiantum nelumboides]